MDGWARGEREDGGVCKVGKKGGGEEGKKGRWSRGKGEEERNGSGGRRGWGGSLSRFFYVSTVCLFSPFSLCHISTKVRSKRKARSRKSNS